jgi:hypothetical protein
LERKFEIVLITEIAQMEPKSSANESGRRNLPAAQSSVAIEPVLCELRRIDDCSMSAARTWRKFRKVLQTTTHLLTLGAALVAKVES